MSIADGGVVGYGGRYHFVRPDAGDLTRLAELAEQGVVSVHVSETFPLERAADAQRLNAEGRTRGRSWSTVDWRTRRTRTARRARWAPSRGGDSEHQHRGEHRRGHRHSGPPPWPAAGRGPSGSRGGEGVDPALGQRQERQPAAGQSAGDDPGHRHTPCSAALRRARRRRCSPASSAARPAGSARAADRGRAPAGPLRSPLPPHQHHDDHRRRPSPPTSTPSSAGKRTRAGPRRGASPARTASSGSPRAGSTARPPPSSASASPPARPSAGPAGTGPPRNLRRSARARCAARPGTSARSPARTGSRACCPPTGSARARTTTGRSVRVRSPAGPYPPPAPLRRCRTVLHRRA